VFGLVFLRTRSVVAALALRALNNRWVVLNWQVRATYDAARSSAVCARQVRLESRAVLAGPGPGDRAGGRP